MAEKYSLFDIFNRDLKKGMRDTKDRHDVSKMQKMLRELGYSIPDDELGFFGDKTEDAAELFDKEFKANPLDAKFAKHISFVDILLQVLFQKSRDKDEQLDDSGFGSNVPVTNYRFGNNAQLDGLEAVVRDKLGSTSRIVNLAKQYIGEREEPGNKGELVRRFCDGQEGIPWCAGFVHYIMEKSIPGVYSQADHLSALSYKAEASKFKAFHSIDNIHAPHAGDVLVFDRGSGKGHVGIVVSVENGVVTYIDGNDGNAVRARTFSLDKPPASLIGYSNTLELATAKHIKIDEPAKSGGLVPANNKSQLFGLNASKHNDRAFALG